MILFLRRHLLYRKNSAFSLPVLFQRPFSGKMDVVNHWLNKQPEHAFLEEVHGEAAIDWVKKKSESCLKSLGAPTENTLYNEVLSILDCKDKIPHVRKYGKYFYNFWQDAANKRKILF